VLHAYCIFADFAKKYIFLILNVMEHLNLFVFLKQSSPRSVEFCRSHLIWYPTVLYRTLVICEQDHAIPFAAKFKIVSGYWFCLKYLNKLNKQ